MRRDDPFFDPGQQHLPLQICELCDEFGFADHIKLRADPDGDPCRGGWTPNNRKKIEWRLITDLTVRSRKDAIEKLEWYALRWEIEVFHKILKSGCKAEESKLRTAQRLANLIAVFCILSWRVFWMTMLNRSAPNAPPAVALTEAEIVLLDRLLKNSDQKRPLRKTLSHYLIKIARLGGYLARASDPPPGGTVIWRGLARLTDLEFGATINRSYG